MQLWQFLRRLSSLRRVRASVHVLNVSKVFAAKNAQTTTASFFACCSSSCYHLTSLASDLMRGQYGRRLSERLVYDLQTGAENMRLWDCLS